MNRVELKPPHPYGQDLNGESYSWHQLGFRWRWPEGQGPDWSRDMLVADQVLSRIIKNHQHALPLWRFHRRAARSPAGHQFSFVFYGSGGTAEEIRDAATGHPLVQRLLEAGLLEDVFLTQPEQASELHATSDHRWPETLQETWPMFIMGVSQTWLALVEAHAGNAGAGGSGAGGSGKDLDVQLERYSKVNEKVTELWSRYAQHAFFHHLSGVFGYGPVLIRKHIPF